MRDLGRQLVAWLRANGCMETWSSAEIGAALLVSGSYIRKLDHEPKPITVDRASKFIRIAIVEHGYPKAVIVTDPESDSSWIRNVTEGEADDDRGGRPLVEAPHVSAVV